MDVFHVASWHPQVHQVLAAEVIPDLIHHARADSPARIWVPSCSTGEDTYALAIQLFEAFRKSGKPPHFRIFATDRDEATLAHARMGVCEEIAAHELSAELLERYFNGSAARGYRVNDLVRSTIVFGLHDISIHPPIFTNLDFISLRSLSAVFGAQQLSQLVARLHFALRAERWLQFCPGRTYAVAAELFEPVSLEQALYRKRKRDGVTRCAQVPPHDALSIRKAQLETELRSANSTIVSMTEELEATNQKLRSSVAELSSINEELVAFNGEIQFRARVVNETNADLTALISVIDVAVVFVDAKLCIRRFAPSAARLLNLAPGDVGRPLSRIDSELIDGELAGELERAIAAAAATEREIPCPDGRWYLCRVQPIPEGKGAPGAVVTWIDITRTKALQQEVLGAAVLEQQRIGRELHDDVQQELAGLGLLAQSINENWPQADQDSARRLLVRLVDGIVGVNRRVRALAQGLVPVPVDADSLVPALARLARCTQESSGIACELEQLGTVIIADTEAASHLYRIVQEAVHNAVRHSKASRISIRLESGDDDLLLEIRDDGVGIVPRFQMSQGMGVRLMEHRCSIIGGRFTAEQQSTGGTRVCCRVPLKVLHKAE